MEVTTKSCKAVDKIFNEGKLIVTISADAGKMLAVVCNDKYSKDACIISEVTTDNSGKIIIEFTLKRWHNVILSKAKNLLTS